MSYDEYLAHFERIRRQRASGRPDSAQVYTSLQLLCHPSDCMLARMRAILCTARPLISSFCCFQQGIGSSAGGGAAITGANAMGGSLMGVGNGMPGSGQQMMSEEAYVDHCRLFTAQKGVPFNEIQVRQYYRGMRAQMGL
jgi:hypothetical protein